MKTPQKHPLILLLVSVVFSMTPNAWAEWHSGTATTKITPSESIWLAGYGARNHPAEGTRTELYAKALVLQTDEKQKVIVVTADLLTFPKHLYEAIFERLHNRFGIERSQLALCASHTHCGPALHNSLVDLYPDDETQRDKIAKYTDELQDKIVDCVAKAIESSQPSTITYGSSEANFGKNRRKQGPKPVDPRVPALLITGENGKQTVLFLYACHSTTLNDYKWDGDYPGYAQLKLESDHPGLTAMFVQGCGADINPDPRRKISLAVQHGHALAAAVEKVLGSKMLPITPKLDASIEFIKLDYASQPTKKDLQAGVKKKGYKGRWARRLLAQLDEEGKFEEAYQEYPVQVWTLGDKFRMILLGGEVVVDYANRLSKELGPDTWVGGYTNDVMAYIPSKRIQQEGGYEAGAFEGYGLPAKTWCDDIEQRIIDSIYRQIKLQHDLVPRSKNKSTSKNTRFSNPSVK